MAAITHRGVTYTTSAGTPAMVLDLPLWAGVDQDDTDWLQGGVAAGTTPHYPGTLGAFEPRQTDGVNQGNPRLVILSWTGATAAATLTLSGDDLNTIHGCFSEIATAGDTGLSFAAKVITHNSSATETLQIMLVLQ